MILLLLIPLVIYLHFSGSATICTAVFTIGNAVLSSLEGYRTAHILGEAIATILLSGLYFGFLARLDKERWVYWTLMVAGGLLLVAVS